MGHRADERRLGDTALTMASQIAHHFAAAGGVTDVTASLKSRCAVNAARLSA